MQTLGVVSAVFAAIAYIISAYYFYKHDSDGTHSYGFTIGPIMAFGVAMLVGIGTLGIGLLIGNYAGWFK